MIRILFICHGNICRSPMAEFVLKDMVKKAGLEADFEIASAATSSEETGRPVYPPAARKLSEHGIDCRGHRARQMMKRDFEYYDLIICMDAANLRNARRTAGNEGAGKLGLLLDYAGRPGGEVADPWYTGDFDEAWNDVEAGCRGLLNALR